MRFQRASAIENIINYPSMWLTMGVIAVAGMLNMASAALPSSRIRGASAAVPPTPVWPPQFQIDFKEESGLIFKGNTTGTWYYNAAASQERIDRATVCMRENEAGQYIAACNFYAKMNDIHALVFAY